jgi:transcriptional regulator with XRE-family HTH domain
MSQDVLGPLRHLLQRAVQSSGASPRRIEDAIGLWHGKLTQILNGTLDIRVRHLLRLAHFLSVPPAEFLELAYPETTRNAQHRLSDWIGPMRPRFKQEQGAPAITAPASQDELREMMRGLLREELAAVRRPGSAGGDGEGR